MPAEFEILSFLQIILLVVFLCVTGLFLTLTLVFRRRLLGLLISVPTGKWRGLPVRPVVFVAILLGILMAGVLAGASVSPVLVFGYLLGAGLWGVATYFSSEVFVFDAGLVVGLGDGNVHLSWSRVEDYFSHEDKSSVLYVFLYRDERGRQRRFEVRIPKIYHVEFSEVVGDILESRFTARRRQSRIRRELKGM